MGESNVITCVIGNEWWSGPFGRNGSLLAQMKCNNLECNFIQGLSSLCPLFINRMEPDY